MKGLSVTLLLTGLIGAIVCPSFGEVEVIFNSRRPLVDEIIYRFKEAAPLSPRDGSGSIDVAIFSFTSKRLAEYNAMWDDPKASATGDECRRRRDKRYKEIRKEHKAAKNP